jgi:hypothetical protein
MIFAGYRSLAVFSYLISEALQGCFSSQHADDMLDSSKMPTVRSWRPVLVVSREISYWEHLWSRIHRWSRDSAPPATTAYG